MIISAFKAYLKVAWALKTPFVLLMDERYKLLSPIGAWDVYAQKLKQLKYSAYRDCNAFAWVAKAFAYEDEINSIGFVVGLAKWTMRLHSWNCMITTDGVFQGEPQDGRVFDKDKRYWAWVVVM